MSVNYHAFTRMCEWRGGAALVCFLQPLQKALHCARAKG